MNDKERASVVEGLRDLNKNPYSPPVSVIDSLTPISEKTLNLVVDETRLNVLGLPALPVKMSDSVYLSTVGVPSDWRDQVYEDLFGLNRNHRAASLKRFVVNLRLDWRAVHLIIHLVRTRKTSECYNTQGSLRKNDETLKPGENCKWLIHYKYKEILKAIAVCTKESYDSVLAFDQSLRHKRSKRDPSSTVTNLEDGRSFCYISFVNDDGRLESLWVDITSSKDLPQKHFTEKMPVYDGPRCHFVDCPIIYDLKKCARCKEVFYCSTIHQRNDWPEHKLVCIAK